MKKIYLFLLITFPILLFSQSIKGFKLPDSLNNKSYKYIQNAFNYSFQIDNDKTELYANIILLKGKKDNNKNLIFDGQ